MTGKCVVRETNDYVVMSNPFADCSHFPNIHSLRLCLQSIGCTDLNYPDLEALNDDEIIKFFKKRDLDDHDFLKTYVCIDDYARVWGGDNKRKAKFDIKKYVNKSRVAEFLLSATLKPKSDSDRYITVFNEIEIEGDLIAAWFNPSAMPYLVNPTKHESGFTSSFLIQLQPLRSVSTVKVFQQMLRFSDKGTLFLTPSKLQSIAQAKNDDFKTLNRDVIKKVERDLIRQGLIAEDGFVVSPIKKKGRRITYFKIDFKLTDKALSGRFSGLG